MSSESPTDDHERHLKRQKTIESAFEVAYRPLNLSKVNSRTDTIGDRVSSKTDSLFQYANNFYSANQNMLQSGASGTLSTIMDGKNIENSLAGFTECAKVVMKGLDAIKSVHPFIGVAVMAFKLVISLDLARRENNKKVQMIKIQMQDMMSALFELRHMKDPDEIGPGGVTLQGRMQGLMENIAKDITDCGSACDVYMKKSFLAKTVKSKIYEVRLTSYSDIFAEHRSELERALIIHTALGVDAIGEKLVVQGDQLRSINEKLDMMLLFRKMDTPREKDMQNFIEQHGGAKACIERDDLLMTLVTKSGETLSNDHRTGEDLNAMRRKLSKELVEDIDDIIKKNLTLFERKLDIQSQRLSDSIREEGEHIITTILSGAHDRIVDPDLRTIWKDMGWKGSVKARHFVMALHDYFSRKSNEPYVTNHTPEQSDRTLVNDRWALFYLDIAHVQPILEAVDDDGTGFISIEEVNTFAKSRPQGWSLLRWLAYWSAGWHTSISAYKSKIYRLVQDMYYVRFKGLPVNYSLVDEYLGDLSFIKLDLLLRSTRSVDSQVLAETELSKIIESFNTAEEERLERNLRSVDYELDSPATVALITGPGRVERYIYPILYLLLKHHVKILMLTCKHALKKDDVHPLVGSLGSVFKAFGDRMRNLEAVFKQSHSDIKFRLSNFAFGMFELLYGDLQFIPVNNILFTHRDQTVAHVDEDIDSAIAQASTDILRYGTEDTFVSDAYTFQTTSSPSSDDSHPLLGTWTGRCHEIHADGPSSSRDGIIHMKVESVVDKSVTGRAETFFGLINLVGVIESTDMARYAITFKLEYSESRYIRCTGIFDINAQTITGNWIKSEEGSDDGADEDVESSTADGDSVGSNTCRGTESTDTPLDLESNAPSVFSFVFSRTSVMHCRFQSTPEEFMKSAARSRWSFACSSVLADVQQRLWSWRFFKARFAERRLYLEFKQRALFGDHFTPGNPLTENDHDAWSRLRNVISPADARFYESLADSQRLMWHLGYECDVCELELMLSRLMCIDCLHENLDDGIDLCLNCIDKTISRDDFHHEISHSLVKANRVIQDPGKKIIVDLARAKVAYVKELFRSRGLEMHSATTKDGGSQITNGSSPVDNIICALCGKVVLLPGWVCLSCSPDLFICPECEQTNNPSASSPPRAHKPSHVMVRVYDSAEVVKVDTTLERRLQALETKVEQRLEALELSVESRFATLETLLRQVIAQVGALTPTSPQS